MDNDKQVGKNCLTFIHNKKCGKIRFKLYNKFIQSIESPSVRGKIGSYIKDEQLWKSIWDSLDTE